MGVGGCLRPEIYCKMRGCVSIIKKFLVVKKLCEHIKKKDLKNCSVNMLHPIVQTIAFL